MTDPDTGLYDDGARYYNPETFVFTQADSVILDVYNPQALNRYAYCLNNPVKYEDPDGHDPAVVIVVGGAIIIAGFTAICTGVGIAGYGFEEAWPQYKETGRVNLSTVTKEMIRGGGVGFEAGISTSSAVVGGVGAFSLTGRPSAFVYGTAVGGCAGSIVGGAVERGTSGYADGQSFSEIVDSVFNFGNIVSDGSSGVVFSILPEGAAIQTSAPPSDNSMTFGEAVCEFKEGVWDPASYYVKSVSNNLKKEINPKTESVNNKIKSMKKK